MSKPQNYFARQPCGRRDIPHFRVIARGCAYHLLLRDRDLRSPNAIRDQKCEE
jgi:hypothetical protein